VIAKGYESSLWLKSSSATCISFNRLKNSLGISLRPLYANETLLLVSIHPNHVIYAGADVKQFFLASLKVNNAGKLETNCYGIALLNYTS